MLTMIIILWILWRLCRPWGWYRPPMGYRHYHVPMGLWHRPPMGGFHAGGFHGGGFHGGSFHGGGFGGGGRTMGGGAGRGRR